MVGTLIHRARVQRTGLCAAVLIACTGGLLWSRWKAAPERAAAASVASDELTRPGRSAVRAVEARRANAARQFTLSGVVQTTSGRRVPGARVCLGSDSGFDASHCPLADASGEFRLSSHAASGRLWASARGYANGSQAFSLSQPGEHVELTLTLRPAEVLVSGTLVDAMGGVIAGGSVSATLLTSALPITRDVTDAAGRFSIGSTQPMFQLVATAEGYSTAVRPVRGPAEGLIVTLAPAATIVGRAVHTDTGEPAPGLSVSAVGGGGPQDRAFTQTAHDGSFELTGLASGRYVVVAQSERWSSPQTTINVAPGRVSDPLLLEVTGAVALSGSILVDDEPCTDGRLILSGPAPMVLSTDADGSLHGEGLVPGTYSAEARCGYAVPQTESIEVAQAPVERRFNLSAGLSLSGTVTTWSGAPLPGARVAVEPVLRGDEPREAIGQRSQCSSDDAGRFTCIGLRAGEHRAALVDRAGEPALVTLAAGAAPEVTVRAAALGSIQAEFAGPDSPEIVFARNEARQILLGERRGDAFFFERLPLGHYSIVAGSPGVDESAAEQVTLERDGDTRIVTLRAPNTTDLTGRVVDAQNQPVVDAWVRAWPAESELRVSTPLRAVLTDDEGVFAIAGMSRAPYDLSVSSPDGEATARDVRAGEAAVVVRLERASASE